MAELRRRPAGARARCAASPNAHGCASGEPRSGLANPQHRDCAEGATDRGVLSFGYFSLHEHCAAGAARTAEPAAKRRRAGCPESRKVTRSSAGGVEALALQSTRQSEKKELDSRFRGNDEKGCLRRRSGSYGF